MKQEENTLDEFVGSGTRKGDEGFSSIPAPEGSWRMAREKEGKTVYEMGNTILSGKEERIGGGGGQLGGKKPAG